MSKSGVTELTADKRNQLMIHLADQITIGYASVGGKLATTLEGIQKNITKI